MTKFSKMYTLQDSDGMFLDATIQYTGRKTPILTIFGKTNNLWKAVKFSRKSNILKSLKTSKTTFKLNPDTITIKELELRTLV